MSVVIVGGNERMIRRYKELCQQYHCNAKVVIEMNGGLRDIGRPRSCDPVYRNGIPQDGQLRPVRHPRAEHPRCPLPFQLHLRSAEHFGDSCRLLSSSAPIKSTKGDRSI